MKLSIYEIAFKSKYQAKHTDFKQDEHGPNRSPAKHFLAINKLSKTLLPPFTKGCGHLFEKKNEFS